MSAVDRGEVDARAEGVLEPFVGEWIERARRAQEAVRAVLAENNSRVPRIESSRGRYVLVRADRGDDLRGHAVTVRFTDTEWRLIVAAVLTSHGLAPIALPKED